MTTVSIKDGKNRFPELVREAESGKVVTVSRNGVPVCEIVPLSKKHGGVNWQVGKRFLREHGVGDPFPHIARDFDAPLSEDFLLKPLPEPRRRRK
jgi:prevent-host-death family protein